MRVPTLSVKDIFDRAYELTNREERDAYLDQICADAPEMREKVEGLLRAYEEAGSQFLKSPPIPLDPTGAHQPISDPEATGAHQPISDPEATGAHEPKNDTPYNSAADVRTPLDRVEAVPQQSPDRIEEQIGPYRLVKKLGEGGMGAVYLAKQEKPIRRQVALKIIKSGMDSDHVIARFDAERQALTMMDHVSIARVFDAGTTSNGQPYFVMELVDGIPMSRFCNENALTLRERLSLFVSVCQAVQHAHQKGIMHRDIKPSNVLVAWKEGKAIPKVIDFGLAKAIEQPLTDCEELTHFGSILGTPEYMSPEQAEGSSQAIDTRTDVYSLGVMLYELLTGTIPLDRAVKRGGFVETLKRIKEEIPPKPSKRAAELGDRKGKIAEQRKTDPAKLVKSLRGELDWIVLKALEKDPNRRYESAISFANDVQRYLDDEPVHACPPSTRYLLGKFARKHRTSLSVACGIVALLLVGMVLLRSSFRKVKDAENIAEKSKNRTGRAEKQTSVAFKMVWANLHGQVGTRTQPGETELAFMRRVYDEYKQLVKLDIDATPQERAEAAESAYIAARYAELMGLGEIEQFFDKAIELYQALAADFPGEFNYRTELARCIFDKASFLSRTKVFSAAEACYLRAIELIVEAIAEFPDEMSGLQRELAITYNDYGVLLRMNDKLKDAERAFRETVALGRSVVALHPKNIRFLTDLSAGYHNLGNAVRDLGNAEESLGFYGKALALFAAPDLPPKDATEVVRNAHWDRAHALGILHRHNEAIEDWEQAIKLADVKTQHHLDDFLKAERMELKLKASNKPSAEMFYDAAVVNARAVLAAQVEDESELLSRYFRRCLDLLKQAKAAGWFRDPKAIEKLNREKAFEELNQTNEFKMFLESLPAAKDSKDSPEKK